MEISSRWKNNRRQSIEAGVPGRLREQNTAWVIGYDGYDGYQPGKEIWSWSITYLGIVKALVHTRRKNIWDGVEGLGRD